MAKFCKNCGTPLSEGATFCGKCGTPVNAPPAGPGSLPNLSLKSSPMKIGILACGAVTVLSPFLPFLTASFMGFTESISLMNKEFNEQGIVGGIFFLLLGLAIIGLELFDLKLFSMVASIITLLLNILNFFLVNNALEVSFGIKRGIGFWLLFLAATVATVLSIISFLDSRKNQ